MIIKYHTNIFDALDEAGKGSATTHIRNMQKIEEHRTLARRIKYTKVKSKKPGTTFVTKQQTDGSRLEITDKISLENVIVAENLKSTTIPKELDHYLMTLSCT